MNKQCEHEHAIRLDSYNLQACTRRNETNIDAWCPICGGVRTGEDEEEDASYSLWVLPGTPEAKEI